MPHKMKAIGILVFCLFGLPAAFWFSSYSGEAPLNDHSLDNVLQNPTEAPGGLVGSFVDTLRCPANLQGLGPTWRSITVGQSSLQDLETLYSPYRGRAREATPFPPILEYDETNLDAVYAPNYQITVDARYLLESDLSDKVEACIVNNKIAALMIFNNDPILPAEIQEWISLMGRPAIISWHEAWIEHTRMLHWPEAGVSVTVRNYAVVEWVYFYPFRTSNDESLWPLNALLDDPPPDPYYVRDEEVNIFDFEQIERDIILYPTVYYWPSRTPSVPIETILPVPSATLAPAGSRVDGAGVWGISEEF